MAVGLGGELSRSRSCSRTATAPRSRAGSGSTASSTTSRWLLVILVLARARAGRRRGCGRLRAWAPAAVVAVAVARSGRRGRRRPSARRGTSYRRRTASARSRSWTGSTAHVPCDARILPDRVTLGTFVAATGRVSVVEGMGPYLRPEMLHPVLADVPARAPVLRASGRRARLPAPARASTTSSSSRACGSAAWSARSTSGVDPAALARRRLPAAGLHEPRRRRLPRPRSDAGARLPRPGRACRLHVHRTACGGRVMTAAKVALRGHRDRAPRVPRRRRAVVGAARRRRAHARARPQAASRRGAARTPIKHIVFLVKENRTYDNLFGLFPGGDGPTSAFGPTARPIPLMPLPDKQTDLQHSYFAAHHDINGGAMDGFSPSRTSPATSPTWRSRRRSPASSRRTGAGRATTSSWTGCSRRPRRRACRTSSHSIAASSAGVIDGPNFRTTRWGCDDPAGITAPAIRHGKLVRVRPCFNIPTTAGLLRTGLDSGATTARRGGELGYGWVAVDADQVHPRTDWRGRSTCSRSSGSRTTISQGYLAAGHVDRAAVQPERDHPRRRRRCARARTGPSAS